MIVCKELGYPAPQWTASFDFAIENGQWIGIAGPSGGGKSTLLNLLIGFITPTKGSLSDDGKDLLPLAPHARGMNYMFQHSSLLPHFTCRKNLDLALHDASDGLKKKSDLIHAALDIACVPEALLKRYPHELSGGESARMNLARTLLRPSKWILLDEPFAALDVDLRLKILARLGRWQRERGVGIFMVSHEPTDSMMMADQLLFVDQGQIVAQGRPSDLATAPKSIAMAKLLKSVSVFRHGNQTVSLSPQDLFTSMGDLVLNSNKETSGTMIHYTCKNWRIVQLGAAQMVIDLDDDQYWLLPLNRSFSGSFHFFEKSLRILSS